MLRKLISIFATICLAISFLAAGLGVCAGIPQITRMLAEANSNYEISPYPKDALVDLACETRAFTVEDYGRADGGDAYAAERLMEEIQDAQVYVQNTTDGILSGKTDSKPHDTAIDDRYILDEAAIAHLNDVHAVIAAAFWLLIIIAILAVASLAHVFVRYGKRAGANVLLASGISMLAIIVLLACWGALAFDSFFTVFHSLFFSEGSWLFNYDSLLICMYPTGFWVGMGAIWVGTTALLSAVAVIVGLVLKRTKPSNPAKAHSTRSIH